MAGVSGHFWKFGRLNDEKFEVPTSLYTINDQPNKINIKNRDKFLKIFLGDISTSIFVKILVSDFAGKFVVDLARGA